MTKPNHWFLGALSSRNNAVVLMDSATNLLKSKNPHHGLFILMTANEELEKAIWCLLVHYGFINSSKIDTVFKQHEHKIFLFHLIYNLLEFKNGEIYLKNTSLKKFDLKKHAQKNNTYVQNYKTLRESCLYVKDSAVSGWKNPKKQLLEMRDFKKIIERQKDNFLGLLQFLHMLGDYDFAKSGSSHFKFFPKRNKKMDKEYSFSLISIAKVKDREIMLSRIPYTKYTI